MGSRREGMCPLIVSITKPVPNGPRAYPPLIPPRLIPMHRPGFMPQRA